MDLTSFLNSAFINIETLEELYEKYQKNPSQIEPEMQALFKSFDNQSKFLLDQGDLRRSVTSSLEIQPSEDHKEMRISQLMTAYRTYGHLFAKFNPIEVNPPSEPWQLSLETLGFKENELTELFPTCGSMGKEEATLQEIINNFKEIYCGNIGIEYMGTQNPELEKWIQEQIEPNRFKENLSIDEKRTILNYLNKSELFENFLHTKYVGQKRFSLEGGETLIPILANVINTGAKLGIDHFVLGMAHRGRLNVLSNILDKSHSIIFSEFEDRWIPNSFEGSGDVKYHKGFKSTKLTDIGKEVTINLAPNPSHLEAVNPVVEGRVRAIQFLMQSKDAEKRAIPILIHGDAALAGQGIVYETMQMYKLEGYSTGGTFHIVINNQIGFTTIPKDNRSTSYCTDIARAFNAPVFHVNGEDPEGCIRATNLAIAIRQKFHCDVFIDLYCYRKYGHNESDEPAFTQPLEYQIIRQKMPIREIYRDQLIHQGILEKSMAESLEVEFKESLQKALDGTKSPNEPPPVRPNLALQSSKSKEELEEMLRFIPTAVKEEVLIEVGEKICEVPPKFTLHKKLIQLNNDRLAMIQGKKPIDWGMGELLAYATLLWEGVNIRIAGQDSCRGTFSHRHAMWMDQDQEKAYYPLKHLKQNQGHFDVYNSLLSEYAALGFEYGYSLGALNALVIWEAQFGDFANGAQVMIDQFIASSEQKWGQKNNLVMFLPHGYEGQGPEHSSGRIERFLSLSANNNMFVINPSTPAQLFHLLRRQIYRNSPKPLIIFTPKALLRHSECVNNISDFTQQGFFEVIDDPISPLKAEKIIFCSGKVYYDLIAERIARKSNSFAIIRIEQLYPLHEEQITAMIKKYSNGQHYYWVQEEPKNKGAWGYISSKLEEMLPEGKKIKYIGRKESAASATGSIGRHKQEYETFMKELFTES